MTSLYELLEECGTGYVRKHARGCRSVFDVYESCLSSCETDAQLRDRIKRDLLERADHD